jgi:DNA polymerase-3 subunit delta'
LTVDQVALQRQRAAPWIDQQVMRLLAQKGHAWLVHGPSGLGQYALAMELARAWLCEQPTETGSCGNCASCHAIDVRTHADLCVLMPETFMLDLAWPLSEKAQAEIDDKKRKPSREIRIEGMRDAIEFAQRTSARGRGKVVLVFPAEDMNNITANALLKTLEEPPGDVKFILASESAHKLLPTIRSRCLGQAMLWPDPHAAQSWLVGQGLSADEARAMLMASGGRPEDALAFAKTGRNAAQWAGLVPALMRGDSAFVKDWGASDLIDAMQKLCHDALAMNMGAKPRFFPESALIALSPGSTASLGQWNRSLVAARKTMNHPFNAGLMQEALVESAQSALNSAFRRTL